MDQDKMDESKNEEEKLTEDLIKIDEVAQQYQARALVICCIYIILLAFSFNSYVFITARIPTRCRIPECEGPKPKFNQPWLSNAIPTSGSTTDHCTRYAINTSLQLDYSIADKACPAEMFLNTTVSCEEFVYENEDSVVYDFDMACKEWKRTLLGSYRLIGTLVAQPITGAVSDRWGRRIALVYSALNTAWLGVSRYWCSSYLCFALTEVAESFVGAGGFTCAYIYMLELVDPKYRVAIGATLNTAFSLGQVLLSGIAWAVPNWRRMTLALYVPQLSVIPLIWLLKESARWLISKGRYEDSKRVSRKISGNKRLQYSNNVDRMVNEETTGSTKDVKVEDTIGKTKETRIKNIESSDEAKKILKEQKITEEAEDQWLIVLIFRHKPVLLRCLICPVLFITTTLVYYGLFLNALSLSGNSYVNYAIVSIAQIPGFWVAVFLMNYGRRPVLIGGFWFCAVCMVAFMLLPKDYYGLSLTVYLTGKLCIALVVTSIYTYVTEIFPTQYRHRLMAFCSMIGRLGSIAAPLTPALGATIWTHFPFTLFAGFCLVSGLLMFLMPETLGTRLPDTMEEADQLGKRRESALRS